MAFRAACKCPNVVMPSQYCKRLAETEKRSKPIVPPKLDDCGKNRLIRTIGDALLLKMRMRNLRVDGMRVEQFQRGMLEILYGRPERDLKSKSAIKQLHCACLAN
jgi:hypothetical protein